MFDIEHANDSDSDVAIEKVVASENNDENLKDLKSIEVKKEMLKEASDKAKKNNQQQKSKFECQIVTKKNEEKRYIKK